jgi:hypothetical protein
MTQMQRIVGLPTNDLPSTVTDNSGANSINTSDTTCLNAQVSNSTVQSETAGNLVQNPLQMPSPEKSLQPRSLRDQPRSLDDSMLNMISPVNPETFESFDTYMSKISRQTSGDQAVTTNIANTTSARGRSMSDAHNTLDSLASIKDALDQILVERQFERKSSVRLPANDAYIRREFQAKYSRGGDASRGRLKRGQTFTMGSNNSSAYTLYNNTYNNDMANGGITGIRAPKFNSGPSNTSLGESTSRSDRNSANSSHSLDLDSAMAAAAILAAGHGIQSRSSTSSFTMVSSNNTINSATSPIQPEELRRQKPDRYRSDQSTEDDPYRHRRGQPGSRNASQDQGFPLLYDDQRRPSMSSLFAQDATDSNRVSTINTTYDSMSDNDGYNSTLHNTDGSLRKFYEENSNNNGASTSKTQRPKILHRHASSSGSGSSHPQSSLPPPSSSSSAVATNASMHVMHLPPPMIPTVGDVAPMASISGYLTTFYRNTSVLFKLRPWKSRYYILSGHILYRFKGRELDNTVTDMMKLTPSSVVCVSDEFPGKQYCIEISGAVSPVVTSSSIVTSSNNNGMFNNSATGSSTTANNYAIASNSAPTVWEAKRWYVQAANSTELSQWLSRLKAAVVRAKYATRALPSLPGSILPNNSISGSNSGNSPGASPSGTSLSGGGLSVGNNSINSNFIVTSGSMLNSNNTSSNGRPNIVSSVSQPLPVGHGGRPLVDSNLPNDALHGHSYSSSSQGSNPIRRASETAATTSSHDNSFNGIRSNKSKSMLASTNTLRINIPGVPPPPPPQGPITVNTIATRRNANYVPTQDQTPADEYPPNGGSRQQQQRLGDSYFPEVNNPTSTSFPFRRTHSDQQQQPVNYHSSDVRRILASAPAHIGSSSSNTSIGNMNDSFIYGGKNINESGSGSASSGTRTSNHSSASSSPKSSVAISPASPTYGRRPSLAPVREDR